MGFGDMMKASVEKSEATKQLMKSGLELQGVDASQYTVTYGYFLKKGLMKQTMYNYIVALSKENSDVIVVPMDPDGRCGEMIRFKTSEITNAKITMQGELKFDVAGIKDTFKIMVPPYTAKGTETNYQMAIRQEDESELIRSFFKTK